MPNDPIKLVQGATPSRPRIQAVDCHVGAKIRERRIALGLSQQQVAELIGVTYQQAYKYETGANRISAGRLHRFGQALGVQVGYFFEGLDYGGRMPPAPQRRLMLSLARSFISIARREHQEALCQLARALADRDDEEARLVGEGEKPPPSR